MNDLTEWLRKQLDEDEQAAVAASPGPWKTNAEHDEIHAVDGITVAEGFALSSNQLRATVDHIVRWDPARVLAEVDAKRRLIDEAIRLMSYDGEFEFLELLALPYADRPGYQESWRESPAPPPDSPTDLSWVGGTTVGL
jgi:hypothetical protein